jgi:hypothetical protein
MSTWWLVRETAEISQPSNSTRPPRSYLGTTNHSMRR